MTPAKTRIELLDIIRGLAASAVVLHHVLRSTPGLDSVDFWSQPVSSQLWVRFAFLGDLAVTLFFILSGASLALSLSTREGKFSTRSFYIKRFFRIYPIYIFAILVYFLYRPVYYFLVKPPFNDWLSPQFTNPVSLRTWAAYLTMTFNFTDAPTVFSNVLWSLPIEFQFYLFFPLLFTLLLYRNKTQGIGLVVLFSAMCIVVNSVFAVRGQTLGRLWEFAGGMILGSNALLIQLFCSKHWAKVSLFSIAAVIFIVARMNPHVPIPFVPSNVFDVLFSFAIITLALSFADWVPQNRIGKKLVNIGLWSYSVYIIHNLWLGFFVPIIRHLELPSLLHFFIIFPLVYALTIWSSHKMYILIERPFISLGRVMDRRLSIPHDTGFLKSTQENI